MLTGVGVGICVAMIHYNRGERISNIICTNRSSPSYSIDRTGEAKRSEVRWSGSVDVRVVGNVECRTLVIILQLTWPVSVGLMLK